MTAVTRRRARVATGVAVAALLGLVAAVPARAGDDFVAGSGSAAASSVQEGPKASGLALTILFGESVSGYIGTAAQSFAQTIDMGILGTLLTAKQCDGSPGALRPDQIPTPTRVDSRDADSDRGRTRTYNSTQPGSPVLVTVGKEEASATRDPGGRAKATMATASIPGVVDMRSGTAETQTGVVKSASRVARASVDLGNLDLFGGVIKLTHLHWTARQQTGKDAGADGSFSIGSAQLGGQSLPTGDPAAVIAAISQVTSQVGVALEPPTVTEENGVVHVTPLVVHLQASPVQQKVTSPLLVAIQPGRQAVTAALTKISCRWQTLITVADVSLGPTTGSGAFELGFGGAAATTEGTRFENPFTGFGPPANGILPVALSPPGTSSVLGAHSGGNGFGPAAAGGAVGSSRGRRTSPGGGVLAGARSLPGSTGGWTVLVGFLALAGVVAVAGADWWRVRRSGSGGAP